MSTPEQQKSYHINSHPLTWAVCLAPLQ